MTFPESSADSLALSADSLAFRNPRPDNHWLLDICYPTLTITDHSMIVFRRREIVNLWPIIQPYVKIGTVLSITYLPWIVQYEGEAKTEKKKENLSF